VKPTGITGARVKTKKSAEADLVSLTSLPVGGSAIEVDRCTTISIKLL